MNPLLKWSLIILGVLVALGLAAFGGFSYYASESATNPAYFEEEIVAFEKMDAERFPAPGQVVFVGSSSIRFWDTLAEDMAPLPTIRRGYGGAHMEHVLHNLDRVVINYAPRAVVVFVGGNDIGSGKSAEHVIGNYQLFAERLRAALPESDIWILSMKPSKARWALWDEMLKVNDGMQRIADADPAIHWVDTGGTLLDAAGQPDDVYIFDGLHLNEEGYRRWTAYLRPVLHAAYPDLLLSQ